MRGPARLGTWLALLAVVLVILAGCAEHTTHPTIHAAISGDPTRVRLALDAGAAPNCTDEQGVGPLHWAVGYHFRGTAELLLEAGDGGDTPDAEFEEGEERE